MTLQKDVYCLFSWGKNTFRQLLERRFRGMLKLGQKKITLDGYCFRQSSQAIIQTCKPRTAEVKFQDISAHPKKAG
jgi:hypothetical protein